MTPRKATKAVAKPRARRARAEAKPAIEDPRLLTERVKTRLLDAFRGGVTSIQVACGYAGISERTYRGWRDSAEGGHEELGELFAEIALARSERELTATVLIQQAMGEDWKAAAWYLERAYPERWGRRQEINLATPNPLLLAAAVVQAPRLRPEDEAAQVIATLVESHVLPPQLLEVVSTEVAKSKKRGREA